MDLASRSDSGLLDVYQLFRDIKGIDFVEFGKADVVRHRIVAEIISAYERDAERRAAREEAGRNTGEAPVLWRSFASAF